MQYKCNTNAICITLLTATSVSCPPNMPFLWTDPLEPLHALPLRLSHKSQSGNADADLRRQDLPKCHEALSHCAACSKNIIYKNYMPDAFDGVRLFYVCTEGSGNVLSLGLYAEPCLCGRASDTSEKVGPDRNPHFHGNALGQYLSLIITSFPLSAPMERHRHYEVCVLKFG